MASVHRTHYDVYAIMYRSRTETIFYFVVHYLHSNFIGIGWNWNSKDVARLILVNAMVMELEAETVVEDRK